MHLEQTKYQPARHPFESWGGLQPVLWRFLAHRPAAFGEALLEQGANEWRQLARRCGLHEAGLFSGLPPHTQEATPFTFRYNWSTEVRELWQRSRVPGSGVKCITGGTGDFIRIHPGENGESVIWTHTLGACSALCLVHRVPDGSRAVGLLHYNLVHLEELRRRLFGKLHEIELLDRRYAPAGGFIFTPSEGGKIAMSGHVDQLVTLLNGLYPGFTPAIVPYELNSEAAVNKGVLIVRASWTGPVRFHSWLGEAEVEIGSDAFFCAS